MQKFEGFQKFSKNKLEEKLLKCLSKVVGSPNINSNIKNKLNELIKNIQEV